MRAMRSACLRFIGYLHGICVHRRARTTKPGRAVGKNFAKEAARVGNDRDELAADLPRSSL
jgi:hypothetical protein